MHHHVAAVEWEIDPVSRLALTISVVRELSRALAATWRRTMARAYVTVPN